MIDLEQFEGYTPGPWGVTGRNGYLNQVGIGPSIGCAYGAGDEVRANARLIAAAPDLLAEVKRLREEKAELVGALEMIAGEQPCNDSLMGNADIARAALEKARNHG